MMYDEFIKGTGCRDNDHNREVFNGLEKLYMSLNVTKEQIYEAGKKLVDNSKTEKELALEKEISDKKAALRFEITEHEVTALDYEKFALTSDADEAKRYWKSRAKDERERARQAKAELRTLNHWFSC